MLVLSPHIQMIPCRSDWIVYHSLFGKPLVLDHKAYDFLMGFRVKEQTPSSEEECAVFQQLCDSVLLKGGEIDERELIREKTREYENIVSSGARLTYLSLIMTESCNFSCRYCIAQALRRQRKPGHKTAMCSDTAFRAVDAFASLIRQHGHPEAYLNFSGGEPLLNFETVKAVIGYCKDKYTEIDFHFTMNTNSSLASPEIATFLKEFNVEIATSLDGFQEWNDRVRVFRNSRGTHNSIMGGFNNLKSAGIPLDGFSVTITSENLPGINENLLDWAVSQGYRDIRLDLDVIHLYNVSPDEVAKKLISLKRYGREIGIYVSGFWERPAENMYPSVLDEQTAFCGGQKGHSMCVAPNGNIYICGYSGTKIGSIYDHSPLPNKAYTELITSRFIGNNPRCLGCSIEGQCIGGCFIAEEFASDRAHSVLDFNCRLYKTATVELLKDQTAIS